MSAKIRNTIIIRAIFFLLYVYTIVEMVYDSKKYSKRNEGYDDYTNGCQDAKYHFNQ
jgi:hypothetical protein